MFSINTAKLGDDNQIDLPLNQTSKRKFTIWFDSTGGEDYSFVSNTTSASNQSLSGSFTGAKKYKLPFPLKSRTGFFNVSLKSIIIGQNPINSYSWEDVSSGPPTVWYINNFQLLNSGFKMNLVGSSAYSGYIGDNAERQDDRVALVLPISGDALDLNSVYSNLLDLYSKVSGLTPFGNFQIQTNANGLSNTISPNQPAGDDGVSIGNNFIPRSYPTRVDDISSTFPDTMFYNNEIGIVISTIGSVVAAVVPAGTDKGNPNTVVRYNLPLLVNAAYSAVISDTATTFPEFGRNLYRLFNLPYSFCIQFEEA